MTDSPVTIEDADAIRTITINRPDKLNALNAATIAALTAAFNDRSGDEKFRVIVLRGAGDKAFVAGADISELASLTPREAEAAARKGQALMAAIEASPRPVIAALGGWALGGGLELALACHLRIASSRAKLGLPEIKLGLMPGYGGTQRLARLIGRGAALEMCLTGEPIDAQRALALGLVQRVVEPDDFESSVDALARQIAAQAPIAATSILNAVRLGLDMPLAGGLEIEARSFGLLASTQDMREGTQAFIEKRAAKFSGS